MNARRYSFALLIAALLTLLPVLLLNLQLGRYTLDDGNKARLAAEWQRQTHGIAYLPTSGSDGLFKLERLNDELPHINGVIFGASTAQTVTADMFPAPLRVYNYAQHGHGLLSAISEAEALLKKQPQIQWFIFPLDWSIGFLYQAGEPTPTELARPTAANQPKNTVSFQQRLVDALSYPRIANLGQIALEITRSSDKASTFRQYFLQPASDAYRCLDGTWARDFDTLRRGRCAGLHFDGSVRFTDSDPVGNAAPLIANALVASSKYASNLALTKGEPNPVILQRLAAIARQAEQRGGGVIVWMPPLLTGMEHAFLQHPEYGNYLRHTKQVLGDWAIRENLGILDASAGERYACPAQQFIDQHHALTPCYRKVWEDYWQRVARVENGKVILPKGGMY
jgi:hypothetical protein